LLSPPLPQVLKQARKQTTTRKKKVNVSALKLKTVHEGGNESISKNAVGEGGGVLFLAEYRLTGVVGPEFRTIVALGGSLSPWATSASFTSGMIISGSTPSSCNGLVIGNATPGLKLSVGQVTS